MNFDDMIDNDPVEYIGWMSYSNFLSYIQNYKDILKLKIYEGRKHNLPSGWFSFKDKLNELEKFFDKDSEDTPCYKYGNDNIEIIHNADRGFGCMIFILKNDIARLHRKTKIKKILKKILKKY